MIDKIRILGWKIEERRGRDPYFVLVQPYTHPDGRQENIEHEVHTPEELWHALIAIASDPGEDPDVEPAPGMPPSDLARVGLEELQGVISSAVGPRVGRIAGAILRNPAQARAATDTALGMLSRLSWANRSPRGGR